MDWFSFAAKLGEILIPVIVYLLSRNTEITRHSLAELRSLKKSWNDDGQFQYQWKSEVTQAVKYNSELIEKNSRMIEQLIANQCLQSKEKQQ